MAEPAEQLMKNNFFSWKCEREKKEMTPVNYPTLECTCLKGTASHKGISGRGILIVETIGRAGSDADMNSVFKRPKQETGSSETDTTW